MTISYYRTDWRQANGVKYPDYNELVDVTIDTQRRLLRAKEVWPKGSRTGATHETYEMIFSEKWDRIEGGYALEYFKDGSMNSTLFGTGPSQMDYVM